MRHVPGYLTALTTLLWIVRVSPASAEPREVMVFLDRGGQIVSADGEDVEIPRFGGGDPAWAGLVACVQQKFAPFQVDVVEQRPAHAGFITALVGGSPGLVGHDDATVAGVSPYDGTVLRGALVHVFTQLGTDDVDGLCAVAAHEIGHALGLDHSTRCGDLMSYHHDACGPQRFLDVAAPCGTAGARSCGNGDATQNSFRRLGQLVGFRGGATALPPVTVPDPTSPADAWAGDDAWAADDGWADDEAAADLEPATADAADDADGAPSRSPSPPVDPWGGEEASQVNTDEVDEAPATTPRPAPQHEHQCGRRASARRW